VKFVKEILTEGTYSVSTPSGSKNKTIKAEDIKKYSQTASRMVKAGVKIPAPFKHVNDGKFVTPLEEAVESVDPTKNAGFWEKFYVRKNEHGTLSLYGILEAPGSEEQPDSPAYKVSRTVKDTSIGLLPGFTDGKGREWGEHAMVHVALPVDPVEPDQTNFLPLPEDYEVIAMSRKMTTNVSQVLTLLADRGISLPSDTTSDNFMDRLTVALMNNNSDGGALTKKPNNGKVETYPIMMSLTPKQVEAILAANLTNPETNAPFTPEDLKDTPSEVDQYKSAAEAMSLQLNVVYRDRYQERIKSLVSSKRVSQQYADEHLMPLANSVQMSFENGKPKENHLDLTLRALEALPSIQEATGTSVDTAEFMGRTPAGTVREANPLAGAVMDQERVDALINQVLKVTNY
jgi:hypothetical protein